METSWEESHVSDDPLSWKMLALKAMTICGVIFVLDYFQVGLRLWLGKLKLSAVELDIFFFLGKLVVGRRGG